MELPEKTRWSRKQLFKRGVCNGVLLMSEVLSLISQDELTTEEWAFMFQCLTLSEIPVLNDMEGLDKTILDAWKFGSKKPSPQENADEGRRSDVPLERGPELHQAARS